ncbi:MAG: twin-arginine translocation signal domain-containing protein [Myxococcales bacterium]|nr:twin-arginine translocation signal domain-containing protein [Myxococcales bacterium]
MSKREKDLIPPGNRRQFLKTAAGGAALAATLWLPRRSRGTPLPGTVRRVILINATGGVRWSASFDGQADVRRNPWGLLPWSLIGAGAPPGWGFSRMLLQKPVTAAADWNTAIYPYLRSDDAAHFNLNRPLLNQWNGARLPHFGDLAGQVAVVRVTENPGGQFNGDHALADRAVTTGYRAGQVGIVTVFQHALKQQFGAAFDGFYDLPAVTIGQLPLSFGVGPFTASRPIFIGHPTLLPTLDPGRAAAPWCRALESDRDGAFRDARPADATQAAANLIHDKASGDAHVGQLVHPALHPASASPDGKPSPSLGMLTDGTPLSNDMLGELFGRSAAMAPPGDIYRDAQAAVGRPSWTPLARTTSASARRWRSGSCRPGHRSSASRFRASTPTPARCSIRDPAGGRRRRRWCCWRVPSPASPSRCSEPPTRRPPAGPCGTRRWCSSARSSGAAAARSARTASTRRTGRTTGARITIRGRAGR